MASNFPSSLDSFTNPSSTDAMDSVSVPHATQHSDLNDAVEALQAKVGANSSAVTSSHDYKIADHASRLTTLETLGTPVAYTPTHSNLTVGNGTEIARYTKIGKLVQVSYRLTLGSTTSLSSYVSVGVPFTANAAAFGSGMMTDTGSSNHQMLAVLDAGQSLVSIRSHNISGSYVRADVFTNATTPFTWTTNDILQFSIVYEAQ